MSNSFIRGGKRFCIDDAFEEEDDDIIKVYGSTNERSPLRPKTRYTIIQTDNMRISNETLSKDGDSILHGSYHTNFFDPSLSFWQHPKIKENWKMVFAAFLLLLIGCGLISIGLIGLFVPNSGIQSVVFFIAGIICFIPGAYHVIYIYLAVKGKQGYDFYHLPLFN